MTTLDHADLDEIRTVMSRTEELELGGIKDAQLQRRISSFVRRAGIETDMLAGRLRADAALREKFIDALTINVTSVYRNPTMWDSLAANHLPALGPVVKVWSAGCSVGAEPYSLAIAAKRAGVDMRIVATDIDRRALARARAGRFGEAEVKESPADVIEEYFTKDGKEWVVDPGLQQGITWRHHNLLHDAPPREAPFDLILCRNVVIYFEEEAKRGLHGRFAQALRPGGILFVGGAERVFRPRQLGFETVEASMYRYDPAVTEAA